jgi:cystathionine gamma-lyase
MVNRSLKTLQVRMEQHSKSALKAARFLETHSKVLKVIHPGLPSHPQHAIALRQMYGHNGMISFYVAGNLANSTKFLQTLKLVTLCASLGGDLSTASLP